MNVTLSTTRIPRFAVLLAALLIAMVTLTVVPATRATATPVSTTYVDDTGLTYSGSWATTTDAGYYGGTLHYTNSVGAIASYVFTGSFVRVIGATNTNMGQMGVQICNSGGTGCGAQVVADEAAYMLRKQEVIFQNYNLGSGSHMIKLTLLSTTTGTDNYFHVDGVAYGVPLTGDRYVSSTGCSDLNAGNTSGVPWCTFDRLNGETFAPGARILLHRGSTWNQELGVLYGAGNSGNPIVVDAYGSGDKPRIDRNHDVADRGLWLDNPDWWTLRNLEVSNSGAGIIAYFTTNGHEGLRFEDIYTHDNNAVLIVDYEHWVGPDDLPGMFHGAAILLTGIVPVTASERAITNVVFDRIESYRDTDPIDVAGFNARGLMGLNGFLHMELGHHAAGDITIRNSHLHDGDGCPNFENVEDLKIYSNLVTGMATGYQNLGTTSMFVWGSDDVKISNNVIGYLTRYDHGDGTAIDFEGYDSDATIAGNWFGYNPGAAVEFLEIIPGDRPGDYQTGHVATNNAFQNDNMFVPANPNSFEFANEGTGAFDGTASHNLFYERKGFAPSGAFTLSDNRPVAADGVFAAGHDFSSTQGNLNWNYQSYNGSIWSNLSFDSGSGQWGTASGSVGRFDERPTACATCWVAHTWTAPYSGVVQLRGQVFKNEQGGDGVVTRITMNGTKIWPTSSASQAISANDAVGVVASLDDVSVTTGDVIRFEVGAGSSGSNTSDFTSWAPIVGYSSITGGAVTSVQDTTTGSGINQVNYSSGWSTTGSIHYSLGTNTTDNYRITFTGSQVVIHGGRNSDRGIGAFALCDATGTVCDDAHAEPVDMYNPSLLIDQINWTSPVLAYGTHTVKVTTTNTKNASSSGKIVDLDYATVSTNNFVVNDDVTGSGDNQVNYVSGFWDTAGSVHFNAGTTTTENLLVKFDGTQITVVGGRWTDRGRSGYSICDAAGTNCGAEVTIDQYAATPAGEQRLWTSPILSSGTHTLKIRTMHAKNASSAGYIVDVDYFVIN